MADRVSEILREARPSMNYIPLGRQLPRTPPLMSVKKELDFCHEDSNEEDEELQQSAASHSRDQDDDNQNTTFDFNSFQIKSEPDDPNSMLKGMKGYQLTQTDLDCIEKMRVEKLIKKLRGDLEELQRFLTKEVALLEQALVSRDKARAGLQKFPSCEDFTEWVTVVLEMTSPSTELTDLDAKSLLAMVTRKSIQRATAEKRTELSQMEKMVANKRKKEAQAKGQLEKQVALEQVREAPVTRRRKGRTKALNSVEKQDATNQSKSTRSKLGDSHAGGKDDHVGTQGKTLKKKQKSGAADQKEKKARGPQQKAEAQESNSQESVRGRRAPPGLKHQSHANGGDAPSSSQQAAPLQGRQPAAGEEAQHTVLRRSKRIASRR